MTDYEKRVDESWKDTVAHEKDKQRTQEDVSPQKKQGQKQEGLRVKTSQEQRAQRDEGEVNFFNYVTSLAYQAMIFLGEVPNPMAGKKIEVNLQQAKLLIDTLAMLREKTSGNLNKEEEDLINSAVYELQMKYVEQVSHQGQQS
jgi:hypothetical protein